jgi:hypothetical protein
MKKIQGQYGESEIEIVDDAKRVIVWVWDKHTVSDTIGRYTLQKTYVASIEAAKEVAASSIAQERNIDIETVRRGIVWTE